MYKTIMKHLLLTAIFSTQLPLNTFAMDEIDNELSSAKRKVERIKEQKGRHTFENEFLSFDSSKKQNQAEFTCKTCKNDESQCYGFKGGYSILIEKKAKELNELLAKMEKNNIEK